MCTSCKKFINDQLLTLNKEVCHENWKCIYRNLCHLTLTNNLDLHNFLIIIESGSLSYWIQHTKLYICGKSHALIIFWKLPLILAAKQLDYLVLFVLHPQLRISTLCISVVSICLEIITFLLVRHFTHIMNKISRRRVWKWQICHQSLARESVNN